MMTEGVHGPLELIGEAPLSVVVGAGVEEKGGGSLGSLGGGHGVVGVMMWGVAGCGSGWPQGTRT